MERVTMKAYAVKHKMSIFSVMKLVKSGKVKSEVSEEEGREVTYILCDENEQDDLLNEKESIESDSGLSLEERVKQLDSEVRFLREEVEALKRKVYGG